MIIHDALLNIINNLQKNIQDKILGKKIVVRASKGYKQPETDYTINVTGVAIDYYYDRYVIIIIGREENKQKVENGGGTNTIIKERIIEKPATQTEPAVKPVKKEEESW